MTRPIPNQDGRPAPYAGLVGRSGTPEAVLGDGRLTKRPLMFDGDVFRSQAAERYFVE